MSAAASPYAKFLRLFVVSMFLVALTAPHVHAQSRPQAPTTKAEAGRLAKDVVGNFWVLTLSDPQISADSIVPRLSDPDPRVRLKAANVFSSWGFSKKNTDRWFSPVYKALRVETMPDVRIEQISAIAYMARRAEAYPLVDSLVRVTLDAQSRGETGEIAVTPYWARLRGFALSGKPLLDAFMKAFQSGNAGAIVGVAALDSGRIELLQPLLVEALKFTDAPYPSLDVNVTEAIANIGLPACPAVRALLNAKRLGDLDTVAPSVFGTDGAFSKVSALDTVATLTVVRLAGLTSMTACGKPAIPTVTLLLKSKDVDIPDGLRIRDRTFNGAALSWLEQHGLFGGPPALDAYAQIANDPKIDSRVRDRILQVMARMRALQQ